MYIEIEYEGEKLLIETADDAERSKIEGYESEAGAIWTDFKSWFKRKKEILKDYSVEKLVNLIHKFTKIIHNSCSDFKDIPRPNEHIYLFRNSI